MTEAEYEAWLSRLEIRGDEAWMPGERKAPSETRRRANREYQRKLRLADPEAYRERMRLYHQRRRDLVQSTR